MAIYHYKEALQIAKWREDKLSKSVVYIELADAYIESDQIETAVEYYEKVLEIEKEERDGLNQHVGHIGLGSTYHSWVRRCMSHGSQIQMAIQYYESALEISKREKDKKRETVAQSAIKKLTRIVAKLS